MELGCLLAKNFDCIEGSLLDMNVKPITKVESSRCDFGEHYVTDGDKESL